MDHMLRERAIQYSQAGADCTRNEAVQCSHSCSADMMGESECEHAAQCSEAGSVDGDTASTATPTFCDLLPFSLIPGSVTSTPLDTPREFSTDPSAVHETSDDSDEEYCMPLMLKNTFLYANVLPKGYTPRRTQSCPPRIRHVSTPCVNEAKSPSYEQSEETKRKRKKRPGKASGCITWQDEINDLVQSEGASEKNDNQPKLDAPPLLPTPSSRDVSVRRTGKKQPKAIVSRREAAKAVLSTESFTRNLRGFGWPLCASLIMLCIVILGPLFSAELVENDRSRRNLVSERRKLTKRLKEVERHLKIVDPVTGKKEAVPYVETL